MMSARRLALALLLLAACRPKSAGSSDAARAPEEALPITTTDASDATDATDPGDASDASEHTVDAAHVAETSADGRSAAAPSADAGDAQLASAAVAVTPRVSSAIAVGASGALDVRGFPAVSADGMHVGLIVGDADEGPLALRIVRIDGSTLLDHTLIEAPRRGREPGDKAVRRVAGRAGGAQRVLARADMRALVALDGPALAAALVVGDGQVRVTLPGYAPGVYPSVVLDRGCMPHRLLGVYADAEHGLVVAHVAHTPNDACPAPPSEVPFVADDWRVFALTPLP